MKKLITSVQNEKVKKWSKLQKRKYRLEDGAFLIEGYHLIEEAHKGDWEIVEIILEQSASVPDWAGNYPVIMVSDNVFKHIADTKTPQGIAAVVKMKQAEWNPGNTVLLVDAIQDPGNLGTIIRTADAAGFDAVVLGNGTVDLLNGKVIRSTQGSLFHIPVFQEDLLQKIGELKQNGFAIWASALKDAVPYNELDDVPKIALVVGNEASGIREEILLEADTIVKIPMYGKAESLNVSVAAGILMYYLATEQKNDYNNIK